MAAASGPCSDGGLENAPARSGDDDSHDGTGEKAPARSHDDSDDSDGPG